MWRPTVLTVSLIAVWALVAHDRVAVGKEASKRPAEAKQAQPADPDKPGETAADSSQERKASWAPAVEPKPLSPGVQKGLEWLVATQLPDGGWGQGEESVAMRGTPTPTDDNAHAAASVADTCVATLAFIRSGQTPREGEHASVVRRAVDYVCQEIEESDDSSLYVTDVRGTRVQSKLGPYIDTFMAALMLTEVKDQMPDASGNARVAAAIEKVMNKIEHNQRPDGTWDGNGWAPVLSQAMAGKALNRAVQAGIEVDEQVRARSEKYADSQFDRKSRVFGGGGSAGVQLYAAASSLGALRDSDNSNAMLEDKVKDDLRKATSDEEREKSAELLTRFAENKRALQAVEDTVIERLDDAKFVAGFGSNGGEEFLSYMNVGESLVVKGGAEWEKWDKSMTENMTRIQNGDGSWTGHHCITGRTFCTSAALLVLMTDRAPVPLAARIKS